MCWCYCPAPDSTERHGAQMDPVKFVFEMFGAVLAVFFVWALVRETRPARRKQGILLGSQVLLAYSLGVGADVSLLPRAVVLAGMVVCVAATLSPVVRRAVGLAEADSNALGGARGDGSTRIDGGATPKA